MGIVSRSSHTYLAEKRHQKGGEISIWEETGKWLKNGTSRRKRLPESYGAKRTRDLPFAEYRPEEETVQESSRPGRERRGKGKDA